MGLHKTWCKIGARDKKVERQAATTYGALAETHANLLTFALNYTPFQFGECIFVCSVTQSVHRPTEIQASGYSSFVLGSHKSDSTWFKLHMLMSLKSCLITFMQITFFGCFTNPLLNPTDPCEYTAGSCVAPVWCGYWLLITTLLPIFFMTETNEESFPTCK